MNIRELEIRKEEENRRKGLIFSGIFHSAIIILLLLPLLKYPDPPPGQQGILVSFGAPDIGQGDSRPDTQQEEVVDPKPPSETEQKVEPVSPSAPKEQAEQVKEVVTTESPSEVAFKKREEERKKQEESDRRAEEQRKKAEADAEKKRQAEEDARKKAELEKAKKQFGDAFGGSGKGQTDKPGNQGDPGGDPDAKALEGISTGKGTIGGGLVGRDVVFTPTITHNSQKTGRVVVRICVDRNGNVVSANSQQQGSSTIDSELRQIAETNARKFKFSAGTIDNQCGTVTIYFRVK
jgi:outer membrane biosynthesis protein TonB